MEPTLIEIEGIEGEIELLGKIEMVDNGIGPYEYWGSKCVDIQIGPEVQEISWDKTKYSEEQNKIIDKYIDDNFDDLAQKMEEEFEPPEEIEPDFPEPDFPESIDGCFGQHKPLSDFPTFPEDEK